LWQTYICSLVSGFAQYNYSQYSLCMENPSLTRHIVLKKGKLTALWTLH